MSKILLFTTHIQKSDLSKLSELLDSFSEIKKWTVDLDDHVRVLRITGNNLHKSTLQKQLRDNGFECQYMPINLDGALYWKENSDLF